MERCDEEAAGCKHDATSDAHQFNFSLGFDQEPMPSGAFSFELAVRRRVCDLRTPGRVQQG